MTTIAPSATQTPATTPRPPPRTPLTLYGNRCGARFTVQIETMAASMVSTPLSRRIAWPAPMVVPPSARRGISSFAKKPRIQTGRVGRTNTPPPTNHPVSTDLPASRRSSASCGLSAAMLTNHHRPAGAEFANRVIGGKLRRRTTRNSALRAVNGRLDWHDGPGTVSACWGPRDEHRVRATRPQVAD